MEFPLEQIRTDPTQRVRETTHIADPELGEEYLTQHRNGAQFPAVVLRAPGSCWRGIPAPQSPAGPAPDRFSACVVQISSGDLAQALGAQLNQMGRGAAHLVGGLRPR